MSKIRTAGVLSENAKKTNKKNERTIGKTNLLSKKEEAALKQATYDPKSTQNPLLFLTAEYTPAIETP